MLYCGDFEVCLFANFRLWGLLGICFPRSFAGGWFGFIPLRAGSCVCVFGWFVISLRWF